jgi:hypothetical protein
MISQKLKFKLQRIIYEFNFWFKNVLKYKHGYAKNCLGKKSKKCPVCSTPWPKLQKNPTQKYLESINYYSKYIQVWRPSNEGDGLNHIGGVFKGGFLNLPQGITGEEMKKIAQILKPEYDILTKGTCQEESKRIAALQGYDEKNNK